MEKPETWFSNTWRPAMAWQYFAVCIFDFIIFPIAHAQFYASHGATLTEWRPLTLQGGGLYHMAMGAIIGVTSWQRSEEKMATMRVAGGSYTESTHTETTVSKDAALPQPAKVDIKTDTVQVNTAADAVNQKPTRVD